MASTSNPSTPIRLSYYITIFQKFSYLKIALQDLINNRQEDEEIVIAQAHKRVLTVYHNRCFRSGFRTLKKVFAGGLLGWVVEFEAYFDRFRNTVRQGSWKEECLPGANVFFDMAPHLIDQTPQLLGMPQEVRADLRTQRGDSPGIDNFEVVLLYLDGKVTLKGDMLVKDHFPQFAAFGKQGTFLKYGRDMQEDAFRTGQISCATSGWGTEPEHFWGRLNTNFQGLKLATMKSETRRLWRVLPQPARGDYRRCRLAGDALTGPRC